MRTVALRRPCRHRTSVIRRSPGNVRRWLCVGALGLAAAVTGTAARYELADGTLLEAGVVTLRSGMLIHSVEVDDGAGLVERTHRLEDVVRLHWPEPEALGEARRCLEQGDRHGGLSVLKPLLEQFRPFARLPGSWWVAAARLRLQALDPEAEPAELARAARELAAFTDDPEAVGEARLALTELEIRAGRSRLAQTMLDSVLAGSVPAPVRARAWLLRGDIAFAERRFEEAIEAYLRIPVFHSAYAELVPAALLAAENAFRAYGDEAQADRLAAERRRYAPALPASGAAAPDLVSAFPASL